jgi:hypothetical protein
MGINIVRFHTPKASFPAILSNTALFAKIFHFFGLLDLTFLSAYCLLMFYIEAVRRSGVLIWQIHEDRDSNRPGAVPN